MTPYAIRILLIEDDPIAVELTRALLGMLKDAVELRHAGTLEMGLDELRARRFDLVLLDMSLPDGEDERNVTAVRMVCPSIPVAVLTSRDDEALAGRCLASGAQDYIRKSEISVHVLHRAMLYARVRFHSDHTRRLESVLERYRLAPSRPLDQSDTVEVGLRARSPRAADAIVAGYRSVLRSWLVGPSAVREEMQTELLHVAKTLGRLGAGTDDVKRIHSEVVEGLVASGQVRQDALAESRFALIDVLGHLVDFYRRNPLSAPDSREHAAYSIS
ncbi:MAG: DNA-binding NarL/FixJ family response regulator [Myxococcota bacterium]|jgi:DNA-binding NarL/FixJ family response regulator